MKFIGKILLTLFILFLLVLLALSILLQTSWSAGWISRTVSDNTRYQLSLSIIEHSFSSPSHLLLKDVAFGRKGRAPTLMAKKVDLGLSLIQFSNPMQFTTIHLYQGALNLGEKSDLFALSAGKLQLTQMTVNISQFGLPAKAENVTGAISPWKPHVGSSLVNNANFQFTARSLNLAGMDGTHLLVRGKVQDNKLILSNFGADVARGSLTGSAERDVKGNWIIPRLHLSSLRFQTSKNLNDFFRPLFALPSLHIDRLDVRASSILGPDWAANEFNFSLKDLTLQQGNWLSIEGSLSLNASSLMRKGLFLNEPSVNMTFSPQGIELTQFSSRWVNGLIRAAGKWDRSDKRLTLDDLAFSGLQYPLPRNWRDILSQPLPSWLESIEISHFRANNNLIIDVNPDFPFEITALEGRGDHLLLAKDRHWGFRGGALDLNAAEATFNRVGLRHPSLALTANQSLIGVAEMSALVHNGRLKAKATLNQTFQRQISLDLNGHNVPLNTLANWGWPGPHLHGESDLKLDLTAHLATDTPLKESINGTLTFSRDNKVIKQIMSDGVIFGQ